MKNIIKDLIFELEFRYGWFFINGKKQQRWSEKMKRRKEEKDGKKA